MQIEHLENHTARLTVEVEPERVEKAMRQAARQISKKVRIPGFRPGKAPYEVVLRFYGREQVMNEALDMLGNDIYREALEASQIEPYAPGSLDNVQMEDGLKLVFSVPKRPIVELGNYRETVRVPYQPEEVTDEMVNRAMEDIRQNEALLESVERPAKLGDQVTFDHIEIVVLASDSGAKEQAEGETAETEQAEAGTEGADEDQDQERVLLHQHDYDRVLRDDEDDLFPGFSAQIVGMSAGESKTFTLDIPADHDIEDLRGKTLRVEADLKQVQARTVPEWSDALAERLSNGQQPTMLEFRVELRKRLEEQAKQIADQKIAEEALDQLVENAEFHYPEEAVKDYTDDLLEELDGVLQRQGGLRLTDYMRILNKTEEDLRAEYRERAITRMKRSLALTEFVIREGLVVNTEEIDAEIEGMVSMIGGEQMDQFRRFLNTAESRLNIANRLASNRALAQLAAIAKGENPPLGPRRSEAAAEAEAAPAESQPEPATSDERNQTEASE